MHCDRISRQAWRPLGAALIFALTAIGSYSGIAAGADGLIIEVHPDPSRAMSDGAQSLTPQAFHNLVKQARRIAEAMDREI